MINPQELRAEFVQIWRIAWPLFIAQLAQMGTGVVDTLMAARYSEEDLAAIAVGYNIWLPIFLLALGVLFATSTLVAQDFGAQRIGNIRRQLPQALWVAIGLGMLTSPLAWFSEPVIQQLGLTSDTQSKALAYTQMVALGLPAASLFQALRFHTQGLGVTKPFAVASVVGFLANIPLNYALIFGHWGFSERGAEGCGIATALSMWLSFSLILVYTLWDRSLRYYLPGRGWVAPQWSIIGEILTLGLPIGLTFFLEVGVFSLIALLVATLGDTAMASHQIAFNIWDMFYIPMLAIGTAMSTRMGHAIGAGNSTGISCALWAGGLIAGLISLGTTATLLLMPEQIVGLYTDDGAIQTLSTRLIRLAAFFILIDGVQIIGSFTLRAYKETRFPFLVMIVAYWLVALPLGWWLGLHQATNLSDGAAGFWHATIAGITICAALVSMRVWHVMRRPLSKTSRRRSRENPANI